MLRILLVDDEVEILENLKELFEIIGYEAMIAFDGFEALKQLAISNFNIILCDMNMPNMSGLDFMEMVASHESFASVPVIFHSGNLEERERVQLEKMGAAAFVEKGTPFEKLNKKIQDILSSQAVNER
jgi:CheY-like chemotaxis protein